MHEPEEVELKLELEPKDLRRLEQSPLLRDEDEATDRLISHYFDTPEHDLRRAGYTLRVRHRGGRDIQTVKQEKPGAAGLFVRPEWERPIKGRSPRIEESDGPLSALIGGHELELAFTTDVKRLVRNIAVGGRMDRSGVRRRPYPGGLGPGRAVRARTGAEKRGSRALIRLGA